MVERPGMKPHWFEEIRAMHFFQVVHDNARDMTLQDLTDNREN